MLPLKQEMLKLVDGGIVKLARTPVIQMHGLLSMQAAT